MRFMKKLYIFLSPYVYWTFSSVVTTLLLFCLQIQQGLYKYVIDFHRLLLFGCFCLQVISHIQAYPFPNLCIVITLLAVYAQSFYVGYEIAILHSSRLRHIFATCWCHALMLSYWDRAVLLNIRQPLNIRLLFLTVGYLLLFLPCLAGDVVLLGRELAGMI